MGNTRAAASDAEPDFREEAAAGDVQDVLVGGGGGSGSGNRGGGGGGGSDGAAARQKVESLLAEMLSDLSPAAAPFAAGAASLRTRQPARKTFTDRLSRFYKATEPAIIAASASTEASKKMSKPRSKIAGSAKNSMANLAIGWDEGEKAPSNEAFVANLERMWAVAMEVDVDGGGLQDADLETLAALAEEVAAFKVEAAGSLQWVGPGGAVGHGPAPSAPNRRVVYLGGLPPGVDDATIAEACAAYGTVASVAMVTSDDLLQFKREGRPVPAGLPAGQACVTFADESAVEQLAASRYLNVDDERVTALPVRERASSDCRGWSAVQLDPASRKAAHAMWEQLPPKLQLYFMSPLGDFDAFGFGFAVARLSSASQAFLHHVSTIDADSASDVPDSATATQLWGELPPILQSMGRHLWPTGPERELPLSAKILAKSIAAVEARVQRGVDVDKLERYVSLYSLSEEWLVDRPTRIPLVYNYQKLWMAVGTVAECEISESGEFVDQADAAKVEAVRATLPQDLKEEYAEASTAEVLAALVELRKACNQPTKEEHPAADEQYELWQFVHGSAPVPVDRALAFFEEGEPLVSMQEVEREHAYMFPNNLKAVPSGLEQEEEPDLSLLRGKGFEDDERDLMTKYMTAQEVSRPPARGHYTKRVSFHDLYVRLERLGDLADMGVVAEEVALGDAEASAEAAEAEAAALALSSSDFSWLKKEEMQAVLGDELTISEYRQIVQQLTALWDHANAHVIRTELTPFIRPGEIHSSGAAQQADDGGNGPSTSVKMIGRRKNSTATVEMEPWTSEREISDNRFYGLALPNAEMDIQVNGKPLAEYFSRELDRYEVIKPLEIAGVLSKYKIACKVRGGGNTGQAGACRLGISRAIAVLEPDARGALKETKMLRRDPRMVERKKPGQKKARKKFQWVKR